MVANAAPGQLNRENDYFSVPGSRLRIWSGEAGLAAPSRVILLILDTQAESGAYSRDSFRFPRRRHSPFFKTASRHRPSPFFKTGGVIVHFLKPPTVIGSVHFLKPAAS